MCTNHKAIKQSKLKSFPDIMTVDEMCALLGVSTKTGYRLLKDGAITALKVGRSYRIPKVHVLAYLKIANRTGVKGSASLRSQTQP